MDSAPTLQPGDRLGEFEVVSRLGKGGMGVVYLARDTRLGRRAALKVIAPHLAGDREFQDRFEAEARSAAAIDHPNAVTVYSAGSAGDHLYIAMRYVEGTDLRRALAETGPLEPRVAARIVSEVAAALDAAHAAGFVHRDVKPANILLAGELGRGAAYLTDFGLTRGLGSSQSELTGTGTWIGTLDYVAPEQIAGGRIDARTDIYSLGSVLYEMLTGSVPFTGDEMQKLWGKANEMPPSLAVDGDPHAFDPVLARAIAKDPEQRFRSAGDLGRATLAAAGAETDAPTERSVATGVAAAGLLQGEAPAQRPQLPRDPTPRERPTTQMPRPAPPRKRRPALRSAAIVASALALAGGLIVAALVLAGDRGAETRTVVTRSEPAPEAAPATTAESPAEAAAEDAAASAAVVEPEPEPASEPEPLRFEGSTYSATLPPGWIQEETEEVASDGSYVENKWGSPDETESLLID